MNAPLAIVPVGPVSRLVCKDVGEAVSEVIGRPIRLLHALAEPQYAHNPAREQYHASAIVKRISNAVDPGRYLLGLGLIDVDLFLPDVPFVFGDADRDLKAAVVSLTRLRSAFYSQGPDREALVRRATAEALHGVGHILGLPHCQAESCAMFLASNFADVDRKKPRFCEGCKDKLAKSQAL